MSDGTFCTGQISLGTFQDLVHFFAHNPSSTQATTLYVSNILSVSEKAEFSIKTCLPYVLMVASVMLQSSQNTFCSKQNDGVEKAPSAASQTQAYRRKDLLQAVQVWKSRQRDPASIRRSSFPDKPAVFSSTYSSQLQWRLPPRVR